MSLARRAALGAPLLHPVALAAISVLVLNDHLFKARYPGLVTGKLSDLAGMIVAPLVVLSVLDALAPMSLLRRRAYPPATAWACAALVACSFALAKTWAPATHAYEEMVALVRAPFECLAAWVRSGQSWNAHVVVVRDPTDLAALPMGIVAAFVVARRSVSPETAR